MSWRTDLESQWLRVRKHDTVVTWAVSAVVIGVAGYWAFHAKSGDAAIYFTFIERFFDLPFSYQPGQVSWGASSPLHVVLHAPIRLLVGVNWVTASKLVNITLLMISVPILARATDARGGGAAVLALLTALNVPLFMATCALYETGLVYLAIAVLYHGIRKGHSLTSAAVAANLHLVRPELAVVAAGVLLHGLLVTRERRRFVLIAAVSLAPTLAFYIYMYAHTGSIVPSSVEARSMLSRETGLDWYARLMDSGLSLVEHKRNLIYPMGAAGLVILLVTAGWRAVWLELILLSAIVAPYVLSPPLRYTARYLLPATPLLAVLAARALRSLSPPKVLIPALALLSLVVSLRWGGDLNRYDYDRLLLQDLAALLNPITYDEDPILLYEIQGQYGIEAPCISMDGIVGGHVLSALQGRERLEDFLRRSGISYVVTANAMNYRSIFRGTILSRLYQHDLSHPTGSTLTLGSLSFEKVITNPDFAEPGRHQDRHFEGLNSGRTLRTYPADDLRWAGHHLMWNSVYRVR